MAEWWYGLQGDSALGVPDHEGAVTRAVTMNTFTLWLSAVASRLSLGPCNVLRIGQFNVFPHSPHALFDRDNRTALLKHFLWIHNSRAFVQGDTVHYGDGK